MDTPAHGPPLLSLQGAGVAFAGQVALHPLNLDLRRGERVAVMGRSGSGKSTLLGLIYRRLADQAALVPQAAALVRPLSVFHNVYMGRLDRASALHNLRVLAWPRRRELAEVGAVLDQVGLADKLRAQAGTLSGGQQQRASVARALYNGRPVLIGDEPVSALDPVQGVQVLRCLAAHHPTPILALHDVPLALAFADRILVLDAGRLVLDAPAQTLRPADLTPVLWLTARHQRRMAAWGRRPGPCRVSARRHGAWAMPVRAGASWPPPPPAGPWRISASPPCTPVRNCCACWGACCTRIWRLWGWPASS